MKEFSSKISVYNLSVCVPDITSLVAVLITQKSEDRFRATAMLIFYILQKRGFNKSCSLFKTCYWSKFGDPV